LSEWRQSTRTARVFARVCGPSALGPLPSGDDGAVAWGSGYAGGRVDRGGDPLRRVPAHGRRVARGTVECSRCGELIEPGHRWDLDHVEGSVRLEYRGPSHARCNRATSDQVGGIW